MSRSPKGQARCSQAYAMLCCAAMWEGDTLPDISQGHVSHRVINPKWHLGSKSAQMKQDVSEHTHDVSMGLQRSGSRSHCIVMVPGQKQPHPQLPGDVLGPQLSLVKRARLMGWPVS